MSQGPLQWRSKIVAYSFWIFQSMFNSFSDEKKVLNGQMENLWKTTLKKTDHLTSNFFIHKFPLVHAWLICLRDSKIFYQPTACLCTIQITLPKPPKTVVQSVWSIPNFQWLLLLDLVPSKQYHTCKENILTAIYLARNTNC